MFKKNKYIILFIIIFLFLICICTNVNASSFSEDNKIINDLYNYGYNYFIDNNLNLYNYVISKQGDSEFYIYMSYEEYSEICVDYHTR